jgi:phosphocarrier protein
MKNFSYLIKDKLGIHARPAGMLVKEAKGYESRITLSVNGKKAEATKIMAVMGLCAKYEQTVEIEITGSDEHSAYEGLREFFEKNF